MGTMTLDTYESIRNLKSAGIEERHAEAIVAEFKKVQDSSLAHLATKEDLIKLEMATREDLARLELATREDLRKHELATQENLKKLEMATKEDLMKLELKVAELKSDIIKWVLGISAAQAALIVTLLRVLK